MLSQRHFDERFVAHLDVEVSNDVRDNLLLHLVEGRLSELGSRTELKYFSEESDDSIESDAALGCLVMPGEVMLNLKQLSVLAVIVMLLH